MYFHRKLYNSKTKNHLLSYHLHRRVNIDGCTDILFYIVIVYTVYLTSQCLGCM